MIDNVEDLLAEAGKLQDVETKTKFIMKYFLENVKYNYAYLFAKGYAQGTISGVSNTAGIAMNKTRTEGDEEFALTRLIIQGESQIFNNILRIRDEKIKDREKYKSIDLTRAVFIRDGFRYSTRANN